MAFIIPNAVDTSSGSKFENLDQAEPDSLDFEILGNIGRSGVISGCEVISVSSNSSVGVSAGTVVINGSSYAVPETASLGLPVSPTGTRFDMIVVRVSSGSASLVVISGDDDDINPEFPKSSSVVAGSYSPSVNINLDTDVVLAAVYRQGIQIITDSRIVDKRTVIKSGIFNKGASAPANTPSATALTDSGELYFRESTPTGTSSGVYVKGLYGEWMELARNIGPHFPIGAIAAWPSKGALPSGFIEADGQSLSATQYPALFAVYGYVYGGSGDSFNVPDLNGKNLKGTTSTTLIGTTVGNDETTLSVDNLPAHSHGIGSHTHTLSHTHSINHSHTGTASSAGNHQHSYTDHKLSASEAYSSGAVSGAGRGRLNPTLTTGGAGAHNHTVSVGAPDPTTTSSQSDATTSPPNTGVTEDTGSTQPFSNVPASAYVRWIIRSAHGADSASVGGNSLLDEALEEIVTLELVGSGSLPASQSSAATFRMPYGAVLNSVRASLNSGGNASGAITVDVNEAGTSVLSTPITIDAGGSSSTAATTPAVISDPAIADDALITIDIDSANTGDSGPLTVTLYFTRDA
jgi:microcystin-dependent protein